MEQIIKFEGENEIEFLKRFSDKNSCYSHLAHYKWSQGFVCPHCGSTEEHHCRKEHHKRCKGCLQIISPTANTLFHKVKFGIEKAFYVVFKMSATTKSISSEQLSKCIGVNRKTALLFQQKIRLAMQSSEKHPMVGQIEVDEAFIGQKEEGRIGRGAENKAQIVVAVEKHGATGVKRMYVRMIENASAEELKTIFDKHISEDAKVLTDKWKGYSPLTELYAISQEKSQPDTNFKVMHRCIQQLKSWLRGIHHSVDHTYLQGYLDEFCYRINRSVHKSTIFENLIARMVAGAYRSKKQIKFAYSK
jgi:transposase-like protein